jgi:hypothetical protein
MLAILVGVALGAITPAPYNPPTVAPATASNPIGINKDSNKTFFLWFLFNPPLSGILFLFYSYICIYYKIFN